MVLKCVIYHEWTSKTQGQPHAMPCYQPRPGKALEHSTWLGTKLEGSVDSVPRDVTLPCLDTFQQLPTSKASRVSRLLT